MIFDKPDLEYVWNTALEKVKRIVEQEKSTDIKDYEGYIYSFTTFDSDNMLIVNAALWNLHWEELDKLNHEQMINIYNIQDLQDAYNNFAWIIWEYLFEGEINDRLKNR